MKYPHCSECGSRLHILGVGMYLCRECNRVVTHFAEKEKGDGVSPRRKSDRQEKKDAKDVGGRRTISSGSTPVDKGDVKAGDIRMECKTTDAKSYRLCVDDLRKIAGHAGMDEIPIFAVQFRMFGEEYYILPKDWALALLRSWRDQKH